ncbi:MAG: helix-turn-helix transcriptional regulator [Burkholderiales bacterium]|nr:helix-turn-helix transcriptional regulator [Burkholderiales bacterium]
MNLQRIKSLDGTDEYVLLPVAVYRALRREIDGELTGKKPARRKDDDYVPFVLEDYVGNPVALARIKANLTQAALGRRMGVSQAYVAKVERQERVSAKLLAKVNAALAGGKIRRAA